MTKDIEKKSCGDWQGGEDVGWAGPTPMVWWVRIRRDIPAIGARLRSKESQPHAEVHSLGHQCWEQESPSRLAVTTSGDCIWVRWGAAGDLGTPFEGPRHGLACSQTHLWALVQRQQLQLGPVGGAKLTGFEARAEEQGSGQFSPGMEALAGAFKRMNKIPAFSI